MTIKIFKIFFCFLKYNNNNNSNIYRDVNNIFNFNFEFFFLNVLSASLSRWKQQKQRREREKKGSKRLLCMDSLLQIVTSTNHIHHKQCWVAHDRFSMDHPPTLFRYSIFFLIKNY